MTSLSNIRRRGGSNGKCIPVEICGGTLVTAIGHNVPPGRSSGFYPTSVLEPLLNRDEYMSCSLIKWTDEPSTGHDRPRLVLREVCTHPEATANMNRRVEAHYLATQAAETCSILPLEGCVHFYAIRVVGTMGLGNREDSGCMTSAA